MQIKALIYAVLFVFDELVFKLIDYIVLETRSLSRADEFLKCIAKAIGNFPDGFCT